MFRIIRKVDQQVLNTITRLHCPILDTLMVIATYAGTGAFLWWITLAMPFTLSDTYRRTGLIMIAALGVNYLISEIIVKKAVGRLRPSANLPDDEMKITKPKDHSFPSGHSSSSFCAFAVVLHCCQPAVWIPALMGAVLIAFSRLYLRVHYLSDVVVGTLLGVIDGTAVVALSNALIP